MTPPVLCYHRIGGPLELGVTRVGRGVFERQMTALARAGWRALTLEEFASRTPPVAPRTLLLTFDDGYASLAETAYPLLRELGFTAATFLITDYIGAENRWDVRYTWHRLRHLDWPAIERWQARGFSFGSHGATHRRLTWLPESAVRDDLHRARDALIRRLGPAAGLAVAYPFAAVNDQVARIAAEVGHAIGFGAGGGSGGGATAPLRLPRSPVYLWDMGAIPLPLRPGVPGRLGRAVARVANRCAVGTSLLLSLARRGPARPGPGS